MGQIGSHELVCEIKYHVYINIVSMGNSLMNFQQLICERTSWTILGTCLKFSKCEYVNVCVFKCICALFSGESFQYEPQIRFQKGYIYLLVLKSHIFSIVGSEEDKQTNKQKTNRL